MIKIYFYEQQYNDVEYFNQVVFKYASMFRDAQNKSLSDFTL